MCWHVASKWTWCGSDCFRIVEIPEIQKPTFKGPMACYFMDAYVEHNKWGDKRQMRWVSFTFHFNIYNITWAASAVKRTPSTLNRNCYPITLSLGMSKVWPVGQSWHGVIFYMARGSLTKMYYLRPASPPPLQFLFSPHGGSTILALATPATPMNLTPPTHR